MQSLQVLWRTDLDEQDPAIQEMRALLMEKGVAAMWPPPSFYGSPVHG